MTLDFAFNMNNMAQNLINFPKDNVMDIYGGVIGIDCDTGVIWDIKEMPKICISSIFYRFLPIFLRIPSNIFPTSTIKILGEKAWAPLALPLAMAPNQIKT